ncbi:sulfate/molybdate ABC transporter ATP-binding protein [Alicyclobacillus shizuokensis]|uniref:sulfate/molybdate ABC transporter ATP-binding protein n=1 Tax=Alicyclobacillus shizuokensis TaxID=392014 RepID=UPI000829F3B6|nr:ABC transporter ATP-binding protein [Alicyclobacillus shizuokensis]MCL6627385.1 ABC transporter ATP-binding protein [Alicyclobacillus shizuokensis]
MTIQVTNLVKRFASGTAALQDVSFSVREGEMIGLLGPSGSGKTTLLRMIAGLDRQTAGEIRIRGQVVDNLPAQRRGVGFVFQNYALFQHMTVFSNIAFGLRVKRLGKREIQDRVMRLLRLVRLEGYEDRYPHQLSGGQAQRVALARALAPEPSVLLLDEPFAAVDTKIRKELRRWVRQIHDEIGITSIFVTHDQEEALEIADRVLVMHQGRVEQFATPQEVWERPLSPFVAGFLGDVNEGAATVRDRQVQLWGHAFPATEFAEGERVRVFVRPSDIDLGPTAPDAVLAQVREAVWAGERTQVRVQLADQSTLQVSLPSDRSVDLTPGQSVSVCIRKFQIFTES